MKFDVEPPSGILKQTVCSVLCVRVFGFTDAGALAQLLESEVRPNDVEMARNFMCTPFFTVLNDFAVFV